MRTYLNCVSRLTVLSLGLMAAIYVAAAVEVQAATVVWSNGANTNVWNTAGDANFRTGGVNVQFFTNDTVSFQDQGSAPFPPGPTNGQEIFIAKVHSWQVNPGGRAWANQWSGNFHCH